MLKKSQLVRLLSILLCLMLSVVSFPTALTESYYDDDIQNEINKFNNDFFNNGLVDIDASDEDDKYDEPNADTYGTYTSTTQEFIEPAWFTSADTSVTEVTSMFTTLSSSISSQYGSNGKFIAPINPPVADSIPISTRAQLTAISNNLSGNYHLTNDIDLSNMEWSPINAFTGTFDGQGYVIRNLKITGSRGSSGLFMSTSGATIINVGLEGTFIDINRVDVYGGYEFNVGGIVATARNSIIKNCYNIGYVSFNTTSDRSITITVIVGGICGYAENVNISDSYNTSDVNAYVFSYGMATLRTGGICGYIRGNIAISNCFNAGAVASNSPFTSKAGGIAGGVVSAITSSIISKCYNVGTVSASVIFPTTSIVAAGAGGIIGGANADYSISNEPIIVDCYNVGDVTSSSNGRPTAGGICSSITDYFTINNCYNIGNINSSFYTPDYNWLGGIVGLNGNGNAYKVSNCYWNIDSNQTTNNAPVSTKLGVGGGIDTTTPLTSSQMRQQSSFIGFDFNTIWAIDPNINNGYPYLRGMTPSGGNNIAETFPIDEIVTASSTTYNPRIALLSAELSSAAYSRNEIENALEEQGFERNNIKSHNYIYDIWQPEYELHNTAHTFAWKVIDDTLVVAVVIRGTDGNILSGSDWGSNLTVTYDNIAHHHSGFNTAMMKVHDNLIKFLNALESDVKNLNTKYLITGHSRGGAVANLLAFLLLDRNNVFCYTFGSPDNALEHETASKWNPSGLFNNIFNICNTEDYITYVPRALGDLVTPNGYSWGKYGKTTWFTKEASKIPGYAGIAGHNIEHYIEFARNSATAGFSINPRSSIPIIATSIMCPVDVQVYNSQGVLVAEIINNKAIYHNLSDNYFLIIIDGDDKHVISLDGQEYNYFLKATDTGVMNFMVSAIDMVTGDIQEQKLFADVALVNGKQMVSVVSGEITAVPDVQLFVFDGSEIIAEIMENGSENVVSNLDDTVIITTTAGKGGTVSGSGSYNKWSNATLTATANSNYIFDGWYESGVKITGASVIYSFTAIADRTLQARFTLKSSSQPPTPPNNNPNRPPSNSPNSPTSTSPSTNNTSDTGTTTTQTKAEINFTDVPS
ncbi:MAG: hypothetical protein FWG36_08995, partial [Oscillospiraceae bacterium]|nr:hypothetical protein [Oscillospiraceae bacterium]